MPLALIPTRSCRLEPQRALRTPLWRAFAVGRGGPSGRAAAGSGVRPGRRECGGKKSNRGLGARRKSESRAYRLEQPRSDAKIACASSLVGPVLGPPADSIPVPFNGSGDRDLEYRTVRDRKGSMDPLRGALFPANASRSRKRPYPARCGDLPPPYDNARWHARSIPPT